MDTSELLSLLGSDVEGGMTASFATGDADTHAQTQGPPVISREFWTAGQRQACALHEISYRACFKPQLPRYFIRRFSAEGDVIYDPFSGRGTTALEAALMNRRVAANDINPLARILLEPRLQPPAHDAVAQRLAQIDRTPQASAEIDLSMFYHPRTEAEIVSLRTYLCAREATGETDGIDRWIRMVATNRLTGHSPGFFSVYTFPPNQAVSAARQRAINVQRKQTPPYRDTHAIILRKTQRLLKNLAADDLATLHTAAQSAKFLTGDARTTPQLSDGSVKLTVTSPPFLDVVQYADDNWLRGWFNGITVNDLAPLITMARTVEAWSVVMAAVLRELKRVTRRGGWIAFEVGEVRNGRIRLDETIMPLGIAAGLRCEAVLINTQRFTKTANLWGVANNTRGTNTNRIVLFRRP